MLSPLELNRSANKRSRLLSGAYSWPIPNRRQFMCRLPFLVIWTFIVIILLYKSLSNTPERNETIEPSKIQALDGGGPDGVQSMAMSLRRDASVSEADKQFLDRISETAPIISKTTAPATMAAPATSSARMNAGQTSAGNPQTSTKKTTTEYNRKSKVFILLVRRPNFRASSTIFSKQRKRSPLRATPNLAHNDNEFTTRDHSQKIPAHIRILIEILESHRIEYTVESTRLGLPTALLTDSSENSENNQFSVIVIDDFLKYTQLDRWMRDQLDRHCRKNRIGVITYLTASELDARRHPAILSSRIEPPSASTTEESIADQFPLSFRPIGKASCKPRNSCSFDYQLNDKSSILRILKRKRDFLLTIPLGDDGTDLMPWVAMSSDHVTYEPLTWARFNRSISSGYRSMSQNHHRSTRYNDPASNLDDNALPRVTKAKIEHEQDDYAYESQDTIERAGRSHAQAVVDAIGGGRSSGSSDGVTQAYAPNQLQAMEQNLRESKARDDSTNNGKEISSDPNSTMHDESSERYPYSSAASNNGREEYGALEPELQVLSMFDRGLYDGIERVIFGRANQHWLDRTLLLDCIEHLSAGKILTPLERYIQIDIDDIFVGERGKRMNQSDVEELINGQQKFAQLIDGGFKFNLGFSGKYYKHGSEAENAGDERLVSKANHFTWFCHTWSHSKAHLANNTSAIEAELQKNLQFAKEHRLPIIGHEGSTDDGLTMLGTYAIAPHHSGVYPVHEELYEAWKNVLGVRVTSTEEYPSLRPASGRRAFVHKAIKVLPRQTCGLYTHTIYKDKYPGGIEKLESSIKGGELFETILHNPVNIYMTHMSNYAHDRLALSTFGALIEFVQTYTNLQLKYASSEGGQLGPLELANYYFNLFPREQQPVWTNPCKDKRHMAIWASDKHKYCSIVPKLLIVGPQKTGTTAFYSFLKLHPEFRSSIQSPIDFEEVQFFNDKHYFKGVDWYFSRFPLDGDSTRSNPVELYYFDKSATYFDDPKVAGRAMGLLPEAKIVILLVDPADRAYSWYQHIKAHGDSVANSMSFEQIIMTRDSGDSANGDDNKGDSHHEMLQNGARALRNRCLQPGYYSVHLSRWLEHYPSHQIIIIDGQWFRQNPASVMNKLQLILRVNRPIDYGNLLVYSEQKGFFCHRSDRKEIKCLGQSKGRKYPPMSHEARLFLNRHYWAYNKQLARLLSDIGQPLPAWLDEAISVGHVSSMVFS